MPRRPARLITELVALARSMGWTDADLAQEIGIDETALSRLRTGDRQPSKRALEKIAQRFGDHRFVKELTWVNIYAESREGRDSTDADPFASDGIPRAAQRPLRTYVERFAEESMQGGRGVYIVGDDANALARVARALRSAFEIARVRLVWMRADQAPNASETRDALAAPLVIVERLDFACTAVLDLLRRRADLLRPTVVTSMQPPDTLADPYIRRIASSVLRRVDLSPVQSKEPLPVSSYAA